MSDPYQERYIHHQQRKKRELMAIMEGRYSERRFSDKAPDYAVVERIANSTRHCPSSCDRHGVRIKIEHERDRKDLLAGLLVGGVGWIHRAPWVLMLWADVSAYKAGREVEWNAPLDAGVMLGYLSLAANEAGLATAICNPQVRPQNREYFQQCYCPKTIENGQFEGAVAIGFPMEGIERPHRDRDVEMIIK